MTIFKLTSTNNIFSYDFILFALKRDETLVDIEIAKHAHIVCGILSYIFIVIFFLICSCEMNHKLRHVLLSFK